MRFPGKMRRDALGCSGMRRDARRVPRGCPASDRPRLKPLALLALPRFLFFMIFTIYSCHWPRLTRFARSSVLSAVHRRWEKLSCGWDKLSCGWDIRCQGPGSPRSPPRSPGPAASSRSALAAASAGWGGTIPTPTALDYQQQLRIFAKSLKKYQKILQRCYLLPCN